MAQLKVNNVAIPESIPLIALKNAVLFPRVVIPIFVQRPKSVNALNDAMAKDRLIFFVTQRHIDDAVTPQDVYSIGTVGRVLSVLKLPDGTLKVDVEGLSRARTRDFISLDPFFKVSIEPYFLTVTDSVDEKVRLRSPPSRSH